MLPEVGFSDVEHIRTSAHERLQQRGELGGRARDLRVAEIRNLEIAGLSGYAVSRTARNA